VVQRHDVIDELRRITGVRRIGHAGTLDPFASGLLIVGVGREATRQLGSFLKLDKSYVAKLKLGAVSDTYDRDGKLQVISNQKPVTRKNIEEVLGKFKGEINQVPPMYSAKKVKGKKLYELARQGKEIARKPNKVKIYELELLNCSIAKLLISIRCRVSSGTYIRSLAHDIGQDLGCGAYLEELQRTAIGDYKLEDAVELKDLSQENWQKKLRKLF